MTQNGESFSIDRWVEGLAVLLESSGLQIEPRLAFSDDLRRELQNVKWGISPSGKDTFAGEQEHDDLVIAVGRGVWWGRKG